MGPNAGRYERDFFQSEPRLAKRKKRIQRESRHSKPGEALEKGEMGGLLANIQRNLLRLHRSTTFRLEDIRESPDSHRRAGQREKRGRSVVGT